MKIRKSTNKKFWPNYSGTGQYVHQHSLVSAAVINGMERKMSKLAACKILIL